MQNDKFLEDCLNSMIEKSRQEKEFKRELEERVRLVSWTPDDPMSPHRRPQSRVYVDETIVDVINNKQYLAFFPESFTFIPAYFKENNITPLYRPISDAEYSKGVLTIAGMIELTNSNVSWRLYRDEDFDDILKTTHEYREYLLSVNKFDKRVPLYMKKVDRFLECMDRGKQRMQSRVQKRKILTQFTDMLKLFVPR